MAALKRRPIPSDLVLAIILALACGAVLAAPAAAFTPGALIRLEGGAEADFLGFSVSGAGDVDGDGHADVLIGAPGKNGNTGQAYLLRGGPGADNVPDIVFSGDASDDYFGLSVSVAGDVNGDGYADVIIGAPTNDSGGTDAGAVYIFYGGLSLDAFPDLVLQGTTPGEYFGYSVSVSGDVNGDGYDDIVVGAPSNGAGGAFAGRAYVFYGGALPHTVPDLIFTGEAAGDNLGYSVSGAGDVNGDGYADVIVGAPFNDTVGSDAGRAYVYYGGPGADSNADLTLDGASAGSEFGYSVSTAGDMNGDGNSDVVVGAVFNGAGRAYVYYGGPVPDVNADLTLSGEAPGDFFGCSVSTPGDVNSDGYSDVIVGASTNDAGGVDAGRAYIYYGGPGADAVADLVVTGDPGEQFGTSVSGAGDVNGDGSPDFIVGATYNYANGLNAGRATVYTPRPFDLLAPHGGEQWIVGQKQRVRWLGADPADLWISFDGGGSYSLLASGVGGGPLNELEVLAPGPETGAARIRLSARGEAVTEANSVASRGVFRIVTPVTPPRAAERVQLARTGVVGERIGAAVSAAGDVNGDGYADFIVGAPLNNTAGPGAGQVYVFWGGPSADDVPDLVLLGEASGDVFGSSVSAGDVNGDGYSDVVVGAYGNNAGGTDAGRVYVYYGGPGVDNVADLVLTGEASPDNFGTSVSATGDVNGDGYADVIVGAPHNAALGGSTGRAYVFYGGPAPDAVADLVLTGEEALSSFGAAVSAVGDVNGDGFGDFVVGAYAYRTIGRAYLFFGGPTADAVPDLVFTGSTAGDELGTSVSAAGDWNGDGFADVMIGSPNAFAGVRNAGAAFIYFGGPEADATPDVTLPGPAEDDQFGRRLALAGDVNGDGYPDVVVGAQSAARAYVFYGGPGADAVPDVTIYGGGGTFGAAVSGAGDVRGDGFADLLVGAPLDATGGSQAGRVYLYDFNRYLIGSPNGGETWNVGAARPISWLGPEPADLWLSTDGGNTYSLLRKHVGGAENNSISLQVPHAPTKFAKVRLTPSSASVSGQDESDSTFTIQVSVSLLALLATPAPEAGAVVTWQTDPGPADLAGYRLERKDGAAAWQTIVPLTRETAYEDVQAKPSSQYRLYAINGLGEELLLGETSFRPREPLAAWPLPYRGQGSLSVSFATYGGLGGGVGAAEVQLFDVRGRLVRRIAQGSYPAGYHAAVWDGRDERGALVPAGVYFLRTRSGAGGERSLKVTVLR
jgi:hypothetical protein